MNPTPREIVDGIVKLEPLPHTIIRLASLVADESKGISDFVDVIVLDEAITANVLKMANSAHSASVTKVTDLRSAVTRLGEGRILSHIIGKSMKDDMSTELTVYGYGENELWRHSIATSLATSYIIRFSPINISEISYTAALLHDIGKLLLSRLVVVGNEKIELIIEETEKGSTFERIESNIIGFSHSVIGAELAKKWNLPEQIVVAIRDHHNTESKPSTTTDCVKMANLVAKTIGEGIGYVGMNLELGSDVADRLSIGRNEFERICVETKVVLQESLDSFL